MAGMLAYELGGVLEPAAASILHPPAPLIRMGVYRAPASLPAGSECFEPSGFEITGADFEFDWHQYSETIETILAQIRKGNVYQVNLTFRLRFQFEGDPRSLFLALGNTQPAPHSAILRAGQDWILSMSPELFFRLSGDRIEVSPMKGTISRGRTNEEDRKQAARLKNDPKSRAENLMIVDLIRNDLGRVAETGSVKVTSLFDIQKLPTLFQMTSDVEARVSPGLPISTLLQAIFPNGSVTGAPKIAAMKLISQLETSTRGAYCGAVGHFSPTGTSFNVAIRTLSLRRVDQGRVPFGSYVGEMGIGSGIVIDSDAKSEWEECRLKADFLTRRTKPFQLIETMVYRQGFERLSKHLGRLQDSAEYFMFPFDREGLEARLEAARLQFSKSGPVRVRLLLDQLGNIQIESTPLTPLDEPVHVGLAAEPVDSHNVFLFHKTTLRQQYLRAQEIAAQHGLWDLIFLNEKGEITEGAICNIFALIKGRWVTAPIECGLLPGVMRSEAIDLLKAEIRPISPEELQGAMEIRVTNSVRGIVRADLVSDRFLLA